jgi:hypothetical protein
VGVESYYPTGTGAINNSLTAGSSHQDFQDTFHSGDLLTLRGVYAENLSSEAVSNVRIRFFLSTDRHIDPSDYQINAEDESSYYREWETFAGESSTLEDYTCRIPSAIPPGKYYVGVMATIDGFSEDDYTDNNQTTFFSPVIIIQTPSITIISPQGGENWAAGSRQTIRWNYAESPGSYVKIELFKGGIFSRIITSSYSIGTSGSGSYNWTIPSTQATGNDYRIRITSTANSVYTDTSDSYFTISIPSYTVTSPDGGENLTAGTQHTITWNYAGTSGTYVNIELLKGGVLNRIIYTYVPVGTDGTGSYVWAIPSIQTPGTDYTVRVSSTINSSWNDTSNSNFTISAP